MWRYLFSTVFCRNFTGVAPFLLVHFVVVLCPIVPLSVVYAYICIAGVKNGAVLVLIIIDVSDQCAM